MQQRKAEILAKRAKLAELKRQRELRQKEFSQTRANTGDASEVQYRLNALPGRVDVANSWLSVDCVACSQPV